MIVLVVYCMMLCLGAAIDAVELSYWLHLMANTLWLCFLLRLEVVSTTEITMERQSGILL